MKNKKEEKNKDEKSKEERKEEKREERIKAEYSAIDFSDEVKRLNRVIGQVEGIKSMLQQQRKLDDVLIQCKAVHSALKSVEQRMLRSHVGYVLDEVGKMEKKKTRAERLEALEELYRHAG